MTPNSNTKSNKINILILFPSFKKKSYFTFNLPSKHFHSSSILLLFIFSVVISIANLGAVFSLACAGNAQRLNEVTFKKRENRNFDRRFNIISLINH